MESKKKTELVETESGMVLARDWGRVASIDCLFFICFTILLILGVTTDFFIETWTLVCYETLDLKPSALAGLFLHLSSRNEVGGAT